MNADIITRSHFARVTPAFVMGCNFDTGAGAGSAGLADEIVSLEI
jgi:hypothetical protein